MPEHVTADAFEQLLALLRELAERIAKLEEAVRALPGRR